MNPTIRVLIVDDHRMFREGVRRRLEDEPDFQVVGEAATAQEAIRLVEERNPSIVILDIRMPDISGIEAVRMLRDRWPDLKILILTGYDFDQYVRAAVRAGIQGYLLKDSPQEALVYALREIANGGTVLPPKIATKVFKSFTPAVGDNRQRHIWELTIREIEILEMLVQGLRNAEIGRRLQISERTVEGHVRNIMSKLGVRSRTEAIRRAAEINLIR